MCWEKIGEEPVVIELDRSNRENFHFSFKSAMGVYDSLHNCQSAAFAALGRHTTTAVGAKLSLAVALSIIVVLSCGITRQEFAGDLIELCAHWF